MQLGENRNIQQILQSVMLHEPITQEKANQLPPRVIANKPDRIAMAVRPWACIIQNEYLCGLVCALSSSA